MDILVSFLRGANMTGHNKIRMTDLTVLYYDIGLADPLTYIQSGNVVFGNPQDLLPGKVASLIENGIRDKFGYTVPALVRTSEELKEIILGNPFRNLDGFDPKRLAVIFLYDTPSSQQTDRVRNVDYPPDKFKIIGREIYIYCPDGFGKTKLYTNFFETRMKVVGTARNWNTVNTVYEMACSGKTGK